MSKAFLRDTVWGELRDSYAPINAADAWISARAEPALAVCEANNAMLYY